MATAFFGGAFFGGEFFSIAASQPAVGGAKKSARKKQRWWLVKDKAYFGTREQIDAVWDAEISEDAPEPPKLKTKAAPRSSRPIAYESEYTPIPQLRLPEYDWTPYYRALLRLQDEEAAQALMAAVLRRLQDDEDDMEVLLLI